MSGGGFGGASDALASRARPAAEALRRAALALVGRGPAGDLRADRLKGLLQGVVSSLGNKALSFLINFISVPLTIGYLGPERFGAWVVIGSALAWIGLSDFGLGNGLTNAITSAASEDRPDLVRMHLSNFMALMLAIAAVLTPIFILAWPHIDFARVFGVRSPGAVSEVNAAMAIAVGVFLLRMPLAITTRVYNAYQEGRIANLWGAAGSLLNLLCLVVVVNFKGGLPTLVLATSGLGVAMEGLNMIWLFGRRRPAIRPGFRHVQLKHASAISSVGLQFFLIQIMALVTFQTDSLMIAHFLGAKSVPPYAVTYTFLNYAYLPQSIIFPYLWTAYNEAITRGDIVWVRRMFRLGVTAGTLGTLLLVLAMLAICRPFIAAWAGSAAVPGLDLAAVIALWVVINAFTNPIACLLAAASHLRNQIVYSALATVANLVLSFYLVQKIGVVGAIGSTVIAYGVFVCGPIFVDARLLLARLDRKAAVAA